MIKRVYGREEAYARILGAVMIISGSLGLGLWYRQQFISRLQTLRELEGILELL